MNTVIETLLNHCSSRNFEKGYVIPKEELELILLSAKQAPSWMNGQHYSIIVVDNPNLKQKISELSGQPQIDKSAVFLLFCANFTHIQKAGELEKKEITIMDSYEFIVTATTDASLAMQNAIVAAESLGYGTVCAGGIRRIAKDIENLLMIPSEAFIVCGLSIGKKDEQLSTERVKPRLPLETIVGYNSFPIVTVEHIQEYNQTMIQFAEVRETKVWSDKMSSYYHTKPLEKSLIDTLKRQGFIK